LTAERAPRRTFALDLSRTQRAGPLLRASDHAGALRSLCRSPDRRSIRDPRPWNGHPAGARPVTAPLTHSTDARSPILKVLLPGDALPSWQLVRPTVIEPPPSAVMAPTAAETV
jgi:hypothetical protein